jgi:hypothetical protein
LRPFRTSWLIVGIADGLSTRDVQALLRILEVIRSAG